MPNEREIDDAVPIFAEYLEKLKKDKGFNTHEFEMKLRRLWDCGYQTLKPIMNKLMETDHEYAPVAAYYAEVNPGHVGNTGPFYKAPHESLCVVSEFKQALADLYGAEHFHHDQTFQVKRERYWQGFFA